MLTLKVLQKIIMGAAKVLLVAGLIFLGACSGCGKNRLFQQSGKLDGLEKIVDVTIEPIDEPKPSEFGHWEQEELKRQTSIKLV